MDITVNYERRGSGSPLVLLHGIGHRWQAWLPVLDRLAERHQVFAVDLPGFGRSPRLPEGTAHDLSGSVGVLRGIFQTLGVENPHVAGNSLGGLLAIEAAAQGLVASATALSPAGFWNRRDRARAFAALRWMRRGARAPQTATRIVLRSDALRNGSLRMLYAHPERIDLKTALGDMGALRGAASFEPTLAAGEDFAWNGPSPAVPLTVAWGAGDRLLPPRQAFRATRLLPSARHVLLPDCGHVPMSDAPGLVADTILHTCATAERPLTVR